MITQSRPKRKVTGGLYQSYRKKRKYEKGNLPTHTKLDDRRTKTLKTMGGNTKKIILSDNIVNLYDPKTKKYFKLKINTLLENPANRHFVRRGIITKGCVIETEKGKAKITNRPSQENVINAVLIK